MILPGVPNQDHGWLEVILPFSVWPLFSLCESMCESVCESLWPTAVDAADGARLVVGRVLGPPEVEGRHAGAGGALGQKAVDRRGAHDKGRRGWTEQAERSRGADVRQEEAWRVEWIGPQYLPMHSFEKKQFRREEKI